MNFYHALRVRYVPESRRSGHLGLKDRFILEFGAVSLVTHMTSSYARIIAQECHRDRGKSNSSYWLSTFYGKPTPSRLKALGVEQYAIFKDRAFMAWLAIKALFLSLIVFNRYLKTVEGVL